MRTLLKLAIILASLPMSASVYAQTEKGESVEDYLCTFAGKCGDQNEDVKREAPDVKGFCLGCADKKATVATAPARKQVATTKAPIQVASKGPMPTKRPVSQAAVRAGTRADLRLSFNYNSDTLTADAQGQARRFAEALKRPELASKRFLIEGHTDKSGGADYNRELSERRARAVAEFLVSQGVSRDRLETRGFGSSQPIGNADQNRRVEAVLLS